MSIDIKQMGCGVLAIFQDQEDTDEGPACVILEEDDVALILRALYPDAAQVFSFPDGKRLGQMVDESLERQKAA